MMLNRFRFSSFFYFFVCVRGGKCIVSWAQRPHDCPLFFSPSSSLPIRSFPDPQVSFICYWTPSNTNTHVRPLWKGTKLLDLGELFSSGTHFNPTLICGGWCFIKMFCGLWNFIWFCRSWLNFHFRVDLSFKKSSFKSQIIDKNT